MRPPPWRYYFHAFFSFFPFFSPYQRLWYTIDLITRMFDIFIGSRKTVRKKCSDIGVIELILLISRFFATPIIIAFEYQKRWTQSRSRLEYNVIYKLQNSFGRVVYESDEKRERENMFKQKV